ncbi:hypothetical protein LJR175_007635 [Variovorax sp. LjRoot175]|uniref:hypothetical protein n=1 Tax=Variovorax sp. LjRoot175 TaxID=3342276 RepID=UPI003ED03079
MSRQQMICFITPRAPANVSHGVKRRIDDMCRQIGRIHFSTLALLPAAPDASALEEPSLLFEVISDEDLAPADLVGLMLQAGFGVLWKLYQVNWPGLRITDPATKREWLRAFLIEHSNLANCGFVGTRDRTVAQVLAENRFFTQARDVLHGLPAANRPADTRMLADRLFDWATHHGFGWVADPAPRSPWRKGPNFGLLCWAALSIRLVLPFVALLGVFTALGFIVVALAHGLTAMNLPVPRDPSAAVLLAALALLLALLVPLALALSTGVGILGLAAVVLLFSVLTAALTVLGGIGAIALGDLSIQVCSVELGLLGVMSLLAFASAAAFIGLIPVLLALRAPPFFPLATILSLMVLAAALTYGFTQLMFGFMASRDCRSLAWSALHILDAQTRLVWALCALVSVAVVAALAIWFLTKTMPKLLRVAQRWDRPGPLADVPAHQVHPSVQACEASLARRTSHMISLTEIRSPYAWHRFWLRFWLSFINVLGEYFFTEGILGSAQGIKFGHWHIIANGRRLLFCSNFDGAFGGYLDEFIRGAAEGANLIWRRSELRKRKAARYDQPAVEARRSFPPTHLHIFKGCKAEQAFKAYARESMLPHLHRFEAYTLSNEDIERATRLREALRGMRSAVKDDQIARALES